MGQETSKPTDPSREIKVIGAGFSRTGTVSLALALEKLLKGPVCHSGTAILKREEDFVKTWIEIQNISTPPPIMEKKLKYVTSGYVACTDMPAILFTEELCTLYPSALVICSTRDPEEWYQSAKFLMAVTNLWWLDILLSPIPTLRCFKEWRESLTARMEKCYEGTSILDMNGPQLLTMHESYVKRVTPPEKLYFFNVKEGWEPLCKILNCPIPDEPFPRANDGKAMEEYFKGVVKLAIGVWIKILGGVGVGMGAVWWGWKSFGG